MDNEEILKILETSIGMKKNESLVYLDLVRAGASSAIDISKRIKMHRPNVYDVLDKLYREGIVKITTFGNKKVFSPIPPTDLLKYHKEKEYDLEKAVPEIEKKYNSSVEKNELVMTEGLRSIKATITNLLKINKPIYTYGIPKEVPEVLGGFIHDFHKKRIEKKIMLYHIYNFDARKRINQLNKMPYTKAKYLPSLYNTKIDTTVCGDQVSLWIWEFPYTNITIKNHQIAKTYENYFKILWEEAKESLDFKPPKSNSKD